MGGYTPKNENESTDSEMFTNVFKTPSKSPTANLLADLSQEIRTGKKKRFAVGWSYAPEASSNRGPNPGCKSCGKKIKKSQGRVRYHYKKKPQFELYDTDQYHCTAECLSKLKNTHIAELKAKTPWNRKTEKEVIKALENVTTPKGY